MRQGGIHVSDALGGVRHQAGSMYAAEESRQRMCVSVSTRLYYVAGHELLMLCSA